MKILLSKLEPSFVVPCSGIRCEADPLIIPISELKEALHHNKCKTLQELCERYCCDSCMASFVIMIEAPLLLFPPVAPPS
jgi:hypothetical protein